MSRRPLAPLLAALVLLLTSACAPALADRNVDSTADTPPVDLLAHTVTGIDGQDVPLEQFRGHVILIVNTASECGFTSQYADLQELHEQYAERGLVILGFPCNDFGGQEPGSNEEIAAFCTGEFGVTFPMMARVGITRDTHPLFRDLQENTPRGIRGPVRWNFTKFLLDRDGQPVDRFSPTTRPNAPRVIERIESLL